MTSDDQDVLTQLAEQRRERESGDGTYKFEITWKQASRSAHQAMRLAHPSASTAGGADGSVAGDHDYPA